MVILSHSWFELGHMKEFHTVKSKVKGLGQRMTVDSGNYFQRADTAALLMVLLGKIRWCYVQGNSIRSSTLFCFKSPFPVSEV